MRLIDADRLLSERRKSTYYHLPNGDIAIPLIDIEHAPTIEQKKGRWERHYSRGRVYANLCWHCSACGYAIPSGWATLYKFCPGCGARMERTEVNEHGI